MPFAITCDACQTRFVLPEQLYERKVKGRVVTIRCKQCHADITIDGVELAARPQPPPKTDRPPALEGYWTVSFGDSDDRELTVPQIAQALVRGEIGAKTIVWRDGMPEWKPIADIAELASLLPDGVPSKPPLQPHPTADRTGGFLGTGMALAGAAAEEPPPESEAEPISVQPLSSQPTPAGDIPGAVALSQGLLFETGAGPGAAALKAPPPPTAEAKQASAEARKPKLPTPKPPARVRTGSIPDVEPPAPAPDAAEPASTPDEEEELPPSSGTPDLRQLTLARKKQENGRAQPNLLMELRAAAPPPEAVLLPPTIDVSDLGKPVDDEDMPPSSEAPPSSDVTSTATPSQRAAKKKRKHKKKRPKVAAVAPEPEVREEPAQKKSGSSIAWLLLAALALVGGWWFFIRKPSAPAEPVSPVAEQKAAEPVTPPEPAPAPLPSPVMTAEPQVPTTAAAQTPTAATAATAPPAPATKPAPLASKPAAGAAEKPKAEAAAKPAAEAAPKPEAKPETTAEAPAPAAAEGPPFDKDAAAAALATAAAQAASCRKDGDPSGAATVVITFAPSGRVTSALVNGPPFAGTPTGGCIAAAMRTAKVPAFAGAHVTVSKRVVIQ